MSSDATTVIHVSDMHFNEEDVYSSNYDSLAAYKEHAYDQLDRLSDDVDIAMFSGDCGDQQDWDELDAWMDQFDDHYSIIGNSDTIGDYREADDVDDPAMLADNAQTQTLEVTEDISYEILHSHNPRHVGIAPGNDPDRHAYIDDADNDRGQARAADGDHDINVTAHYHGEGSFVMEDGKLTLQAGSTADTYITNDAVMPDTSVQKLHFEDNTVTVQHIDFATGETIEQREYHRTDDGFELVSDDGIPTEQRYA
ncbi:MAG: hypothetical protein MUP66_02555 [Candidatus Nanohaloarchaeota archaeon QJJ-5]|nr:hypothetical protein [Candidatus Nanohaloarchaeota archaeon QJJ-5]